MSEATMTWTEFLKDCESFHRMSESLGDTWILHRKNDNEGNTYLVFKQKIPYKTGTPITVEAGDTEDTSPKTADTAEEEVIPVDTTAAQNLTVGTAAAPELAVDTTAAQDLAVDTAVDISDSPEMVELEYHIVYSISYQVPVLYFRAHRSDGSLLGLEDGWRIFRCYNNNFNQQRSDMLAILTQMDHPVLFKPYLALHPCRTATLLAQAGTSRNLVLTFISLMGPYVQLHLSEAYCTLACK